MGHREYVIGEPPGRMRGPHRLPWAVFLSVTAGASAWVSLVLLAHVWPAIFPGQKLDFGIETPAFVEAHVPLPPLPIPDALKIETPEDTFFDHPIIILAVGTDTSAKLDSLNTDTIMLARVDPVTKSVKLLSIPRDLMITIAAPDGTLYEDRINTSFAVGAEEGHTYAAGMAHLSADIERNFGIKPDYWMQVDFRGAERIFDLLGGVDVVIPEDLAVNRWYYSDNDRPARTLSFPSGPQHLSGYEAVAFSRLREFDDDFHRIRRQQIVMEAAMSQAFSKGLLNNVPSLWGAYHDSVTTNIDTARIPGFGLLARQTQGKLTTYSIADPVNGTQTVFDYKTPGGADVLRGDPKNIQHWLDVVFKDAPLESTSASGAAASSP